MKTILLLALCLVLLFGCEKQSDKAPAPEGCDVIYARSMDSLKIQYEKDKITLQEFDSISTVIYHKALYCAYGHI